MVYILYVVLPCALVCTITAAVEKEKSVNLNLETVLEFDNKNLDSDVKIIDNVQKFLSKVRSVLDKSKDYRRGFNTGNMKFTYFLEQVINHLLTYNDDELEEIAVIIYEEIRKYHYKGCKFYELVENNEFRNFVTDMLEGMKKLRGKKMRKLLKHYVKKLQDRNFEQKDLDLVEYVNSLYRSDSKEKMLTVIKNFEDFSKTSRRTHTNLVHVVRKGIRSMIFDHYSSLNENARRDLRMKIESYFIAYIPENGKKGKGKLITEIEYRDTTKSVKEKRRDVSERPRSYKGKGKRTTKESTSLLPTPNRDLEEEKNRMPFRFISLFTEEMHTTSKKLKRSHKKSRSHKHSDKKPALGSNHGEQRPKNKAKKEHPKTMMIVKEGRPLREILTEHNAVIRVMSSRAPKYARVKGLNRAMRKIKLHREAKLNKPRHALVGRPIASQAESTTRKEKLINLYVTETYSQRLFPSDIEATPLKDSLASDKKEKGPSRQRDTASDGEDASGEKLQKVRSFKNVNKNKLKRVTHDVEKSQTEMHSDEENDTQKDKQIASDVEHKSQTPKHSISDVDVASEKSRQYASDAEIFSQRARAFDSDVEDRTEDVSVYSSDIKDNFRRERLIAPEYNPQKTTIEYSGLKNQQRKSFRDNGLAIESFENNVLDEHYIFRKNNANDTFKSNKRSLLRKRSKKARAHEIRYRKKLLPTYVISKSEERQKVAKAVIKKSPKLKMVTKEVSEVRAQKHKQKLHKHLKDRKEHKPRTERKGHKHHTETKHSKKTKKDNKAKPKPRFRSQSSNEKIETTTIAYVSDNYLINKIHNLEKQLEVVINKMDNNTVKGVVSHRAKIYENIETTLKYPLIPYWKGTLKTTRRYSSSSASSEENASDNDTISKPNERISANVTKSNNAENRTITNETIENTDKSRNKVLIQFKSKDQNLADVKINNNNTIKQGNYTANDTKGTMEDKLKENTSNETKPDGRKQGIIHIDNTDEITTKKHAIEDEKSHNVSMKSSVENEHTTKSYNETNTAKNDNSKTATNDNSTKNATSTTKHDKLDKVSKEHSDEDAKSTKKDKYNMSSKGSPNEDSKPLKKDESGDDKPGKDKPGNDKSGLKYTTKNKENHSDEDAKSTKKDKYFRSAVESSNEDSKPLKKGKSRKDKSGLTYTTKNEDKELSSKSSQLTTTCTTTTKAIGTTTDENLSKQTEIDSSKINTAKDETQTLLEKNTTSSHSGNDSNTMSTKFGIKFTISNANMNISSAKNDNDEESNAKKNARRSLVYNPFANSDEEDFKSKREMDDTLYNWA